MDPDEAAAALPRVHRERLHFLDWLRMLMVLGVVYVHTLKSGITGYGGLNQPWMVDDRSLVEYRYFGEAKKLWLQQRSFPGHGDEPWPLYGRYCAVVRQWCLPLLFWVSGAAAACSYKGGMPRGLGKLLAFSLLGMAVNAALWFLGPLDDRCFVDNVADGCQDKGLLFNFTVIVWSGTVFPIVFQMWYTLVLLLLTLLNWPLLAVSRGSAARPCTTLCIQWALNAVFFGGIIFLAGDACPQPGLAVALLFGLDVLFLALVGLASPAWRLKLPDWLPLRAIHYLLAAISLLQFGTIPFADMMTTIGAAYASYIGVGFNRFFNLGVLMTHARLRPEGDQAKPLASRVWPLMLFFIVLCSPSTNWDLAGMLAYPFYRHVIDRLLYIGGAFIVVFVFDRCSRGVQCDTLPVSLTRSSVLLYLIHPLLITLGIQIGLRSAEIIWLLSVLVVVAPTVALTHLYASRAADVGATESQQKTATAHAV